MNHSKLYVPDPNIWINFFRKSSQRKLINQKGGNKMLTTRNSTEPMNVELISPVEAADERTESAIKRLKKKTRSIQPQRRRKRINKRAKTRLSRKQKVGKGKGRKTVKRRTRAKRKKSVKTTRDIFSG